MTEREFRANRFNVSPFTVKNHLARVFEKLPRRCRTEAVMAYLRPPKWRPYIV